MALILPWCQTDAKIEKTVDLLETWQTIFHIYLFSLTNIVIIVIETYFHTVAHGDQVLSLNNVSNTLVISISVLGPCQKLF